jgi:2-methylisocitrate lyase-like PEP mutase family enzyme
MAQQTLDQNNNEQWSTFVKKLTDMLTELYGHTDAANGVAIAALQAAYASGEATSGALTTAAGATASLTITDAKIAATSKVFVSIKNGTNAQGVPVVSEVTPGAGSATVVVQNIHASAALNGTLKLEYFIVV